jgi:hypothetical protein
MMASKTTMNAIDLLIMALKGSRPAVVGLLEKNGYRSRQIGAYIELGYIGVEYLSRIWNAYMVDKDIDVEKLMGTSPSELWEKVDEGIETAVDEIKRHQLEMARERALRKS